jgi:glycosyltransferase EpsF
MQKLLWKYGTTLYACSSMAAETLFGPKCWSDKRVQLLSNAVDLQAFQQLDRDRRTLRTVVTLPDGAIIIGHVGRFDHPKNHQFLVNVFCELLSTISKAHLVMIGDGPLRNQIETQVKSLGIQSKVHFLGVRSDVPALMAGMDLFLFPSLYEGLPVVLIEAQAAGLACVVSNSITHEADVKAGLMNYVGLDEGVHAWINAVEHGLMVRRPAFDERTKAIKQAGFDLDKIVYRLERLYSGR